MSLYKLRDWIDEDKLNINFLCQNISPFAMDLLEKKFLDKMINNSQYKEAWNYLSKNPSDKAIKILEKNMNKINFYELSKNTNPKAIHILKNNMDKNIGWSMINANSSPEAIDLLKQNPNKIWMSCLCRNKSPLVPLLLELVPDFANSLNYFFLSFNNSDWAIDLLEKELQKEIPLINISDLSQNCSRRAVNILKKNLDKINWAHLSTNSAALDLLEKNKEMIDFSGLLLNESPFTIKLIEYLIEEKIVSISDYNVSILSENPYAIHFLEKNQDLICYARISKNPEIFEINKQYLKERIDIFREELCIKVFHPKNEGKLWFFDEYE